MNFRGIRALCVPAAIAVLLAGTAQAADYQVRQDRGVDQQVNYSDLQKMGPWDDRNYRLTRQDLKFLAENEAQLRDPIPAFFRVELRKEFKNMPRTGIVQYPRAAVPLFHKRYGGLMRNGKVAGNHGEAATRVPVPVDGEIQLNQVLGANEATIEINPSNPMQVIAGSNNNGGQEMYYSTDGGDSWTIQGTLPNTCCDPTVGWSSDGSVAYVAALTGTIGVAHWRSFDGGQTWVDRIDLTPGGSDKEFLHVDISPTSPHKDNVYITYHNGNTMQFARSTDFGATFDIQAFPGAPSGIGSDVTTDSAGNIYYFYGAFNNQQIIMLRSTDGGENFGAPVVVADTNGAFDWPVPSMESRRSWIYVAADADRSGGAFDGTIYASWTDTESPEVDSNPNANHNQVHVAYSRDGGATWESSIPHPVNDFLTVDRYNQWMTVDEAGVVHAAFYDTRNSVDRTGVDYYYTFSLDGGVTWNELTRLSSETSSNLTDGQEWGDYNGLTVVGDRILTVWTDNRDGPPNMKDIYAGSATNIAAGPSFVLTGDNAAQQVCAPDSLDDITLSVGQILDFDSPVALAFSGLPAGFSGTISPNPVVPATPSANATVSVNVGSVAAGDYGFSVVGSATGVDDRTVNVAVEVFDAAPGAVTLSMPANGETGTSLSPNFSWNAVAQAGSYTIEIDDDASFSSIDYSATVTETEHTPSINLGTETSYFWRVRADNLCGDGTYSAVSSFTTAALICANPGSPIPDNLPSGVQSTLVLSEEGNLQSLDVSVKVTHTYVGDLRIGLQHIDTGSIVFLMDRPGVPASQFGCSGDNIDATFSDSSSVVVEDECGPGTPTLTGSLMPENSLAVFNGEALSGSWTLFVSDGAGQDTGTLDEWCLLPGTDAVADSDADGVADDSDNCLNVPNPAQTDGDTDGIGNACDADLNNDCTVNFADLELLKQAFFTSDPVADLNSNGNVDFEDLGLMKAAFFGAPGPAAEPNVCSAR